MKYMGSKARFAKEILGIVLKDRLPGQNYVEPFAGGMNMVCHATGNRVANDVHPYLIPMWEALVGGWIPEKVAKETYYAIRKNPEIYPMHLVGWVGFNCSYSGKWWGGFAGETKTKLGTVRDYQAEAIKNVLAQVPSIKGVKFTNKSYLELVIPDNSIVYCDPPYAGTTEYAHAFDHTGFWSWVRNLKQQGHTAFVSEYSAPADFTCVWEKEAKSSLSANGTCGGNKVSVERLFRL